jgi:hypothetical protein
MEAIKHGMVQASRVCKIRMLVRQHWPSHFPSGGFAVKKIVSGLALFALLVNAGMAGAVCSAEGKISRLRTGSFAGNFVDVATPSNLPSFATYFTVPVNGVDYSTLAAAQAGNLTVIVTGDAVSCPTSGTFRNGGNVIEIDIYRNM